MGEILLPEPWLGAWLYSSKGMMLFSMEGAAEVVKIILIF